MVFSTKLLLFTEDNKLIKENLTILDMFSENNIYFAILARRETNKKLESQIPNNYQEKIRFIDRSKEIKTKVLKLKEKGNIFSVIGVVNEDAIFSFNCKIPLFNPERLKVHNATYGEKVKKYGLPINNISDVIDCLTAHEIHKSNYFKIHFDSKKFSVVSLNNANRYHRPEDEVRIKEIFEFNLKGDKSVRDQRILLLLFFHLINEITQNDFFKQVNYWGTFPSSNPNNDNTSVTFLKEAVRHLVNGKPKTGPEILIRNKEMTAKHKSGNRRFVDKCNKDFETLIVNPKLKGKLNNQVICIIDDYITNGYSAEAAKHLLLAAGAERVIFISIGKFGRNYFATDYSIQGDVFSAGYEYKYNSEISHKNDRFYNLENDHEILKFGEIL